MKEREALQCLEQVLQGIRPLAKKASDPFGPDIFYAEDIAQQIVEGIAVLPAGEDVYLVDIVMREPKANSTWGIAVTIPPLKEQTEEAP